MNCKAGDACSKIHIPSNKNIDTQIWMNKHEEEALEESILASSKAH